MQAGLAGYTESAGTTAYHAGGTSLLDLMKLDVLRPQNLIDINPLHATHSEITVSAAGLRLGALARMAEIADNAPLALLATRRTMRGDLAAAVLAQTGHEHIQQTALRATDDFTEGVKSVAERRSGDFAWR